MRGWRRSGGGGGWWVYGAGKYYVMQVVNWSSTLCCRRWWDCVRRKLVVNFKLLQELLVETRVLGVGSMSKSLLNVDQVSPSPFFFSLSSLQYRAFTNLWKFLKKFILHFSSTLYIYIRTETHISFWLFLSPFFFFSS